MAAIAAAPEMPGRETKTSSRHSRRVHRGVAKLAGLVNVGDRSLPLAAALAALAVLSRGSLTSTAVKHKASNRRRKNLFRMCACNKSKLALSSPAKNKKNNLKKGSIYLADPPLFAGKM